LEVLKIIWECGPSTVRDVLTLLNKTGTPRAYTSVMSLMNVMAEKGLLERQPAGRAFVYSTAQRPQETRGDLVRDLLTRAFSGSAAALVAHLFERTTVNAEELAEIRKLIARQKKK
jgi:predicted transcriptional regulator